MVKVPATPGRPARDRTSDRRRHQHQHHAVVLAGGLSRRWRRPISKGLEKYVARGGDPSHVASVASFFVSRIDTAVDKQLDEKIAQANDPSEKERLAALKGKVAIANAKLAYQDYKRLFAGPRWDKLAAKGAKPQRLLWASTGTKNKDYSDVLYVEELIGPNTVNTVPPATLDAFRDHGKLRDSLEENVDDARRVLEELEKSGISLDAITAELVKDGVKLFADAADKLYGAVALQARHRRSAAASTVRSLPLGGDLAQGGRKSTEDWRASAKIRRLWQQGQIGLDRRRRGQMAGLAEQPGRGRHRRLRGLCRAREGTEIHRRRRARHGRIEPRSGSAGGDLCEEVRLSETACAGLDRSGAGARDGSHVSISPGRCSSSPANPAAPPSRT